jgi:hypothetical protein
MNQEEASTSLKPGFLRIKPICLDPAPRIVHSHSFLDSTKRNEPNTASNNILNSDPTEPYYPRNSAHHQLKKHHRTLSIPNLTARTITLDPYCAINVMKTVDSISEENKSSLPPPLPPLPPQSKSSKTKKKHIFASYHKDKEQNCNCLLIFNDIHIFRYNFVVILADSTQTKFFIQEKPTFYPKW